MWTENFQIYKLSLRKRGTRDQIASICWVWRKQGNSRKNISISASLTTVKPLTMWIKTNCEKVVKRWEYQTTDGNTRPPYLSPEKPVCQFCIGIQNRIWNNWLVQIWKRSMSRLYIVTLFIYMQYIMQNDRLDE